MNDRHARALTHSAIDDIFSALERAESQEDFFVEVDEIVNDPARLLSLPTDLGQAPEITPNATGAADLEAGPLVYEYLGPMDPSNASDPRLWNYLAFATFREYMFKRWPLGETTNWKTRVTRRWLMMNPNRQNLVRHGIARLWWISSITYDARSEFPLSSAQGTGFAYTRAAFQNEDRIQATFEREAGSVRSLVRAVLEWATAGGREATGSEVKALMKEVTLVCGFRDIEALGDEQMRELIRTLAA
jgi:hypothetical protein